MKIFDPLYGDFHIPDFLQPLILAPEVRRLMGVRLLNAPSPTLPTLSEIRRFSHTLGVLRLALSNAHVGLTDNEVKAFAAAILIHDAATPPFAHLVEYHLKDQKGWDHESALPGLLTGHEFADNVSHQILPGEAIKFERICIAAKIDFELVLSIVRKQHRASSLLFGTLDFDNLDNVLRMAWALGLKVSSAPILDIARSIAVGINGEFLLSEALRPAVINWTAIRKAVYEVLVFDETTVATQAVLTKAIRVLFAQRDSDDIHWTSRDSDLIETLSQSPLTKELMLRHFNEDIPRAVFTLRMEGSLKDYGFASREDAIELIENQAKETLELASPFGYVFVDRGAFSKRIDCLDPSTRKGWSEGFSSNSVVFYCFVPRRARLSANAIVSFQKALKQRLALADQRC